MYRIKVRQEQQIVRLPEESVKEMTVEQSKINLKVRDMFSNIITEGDYISYPGRKGSDTYMRTAKVLNVTERTTVFDKKEYVLKVAVAMAPRWAERKKNPNAKTKIVKVTISNFQRSTVIPKSYIQNDSRYKCLLEA